MAEDDLPRREPEGLSDEEFSRLMGSISTMAPLLKGFLPGGGRQESPPHGGPPHGGHGDHGGHCARREALLLALKPYLSPARCAAVDYFIRLARVGDAIRSLQ